MNDNVVVCATAVEKFYDDGNVHALRGVDLSIPERGFVALAGPSGSGKTTLLNLIGGLDVPDSGSIVVDNLHLESLDEKSLTKLRREKIGFIFQQFNLVPVLTARENVELPLEILDGYDRKSMRKASMEMLRLVGLEGLENRLPNKLSGGQQQRIAIARALVKKPAIVLADEPTANLDGETGLSVIKLMKQMRDQLGTAFLLSTHDPRVIKHTDILFEMSDGIILS